VSKGKLTLSKANGWNNGVKALNDICKAIYGNNQSTKYIAEARSINIDDINSITGINPESLRYIGWGETRSTKHFDDIRDPEDDKYWPTNWFPIECLLENGVSEEYIRNNATDGYARHSSDDIIITDSNYHYSTDNDKVMVGDYWLATRCIDVESEPYYKFDEEDNNELPIDPDRATFYLHSVRASIGIVGYESLFTGVSRDVESSIELAVRPVITLTLKVSPSLEKTVGEVEYWTFE